MKHLSIISTVLAGLIFGPGSTEGHIRTQQAEAANVQAQGRSEGASKPAPQDGPDQAVAGVDLQRTRTYRTRALQRPASVSWETRKIFEMQYVGRRNYISIAGGVDPSTGRNTTGDDGMVLFGGYFFPTDFDFSDPVIADGTLYFNVYIGDGYLIAVDLHAPKDKWAFKLKRRRLSEPAVAGGTVFVGGSDGVFYALDAKTGQEKWKFKNKDSGYLSSPLVEGGVVFFGSTNGSYYAVDAATGKANWTFKAKHAVSSAAIYGDVIYFGSGDELFALDKKTGERKWSIEVKGRRDPPVIADGTIFFSTGDAFFPTGDAFLHAVDLKTGREKWKIELRKAKDWSAKRKGTVGFASSLDLRTSLAVSDGTIYLGWLERLYAFDAATGKQKWEFEVGTPMRSPVVAEGVVYFGSYGRLYAVDAGTGAKLWTIATTSEVKKRTLVNVPSSPAVLNGAIYYVSDDGKVYAIG